MQREMRLLVSAIMALVFAVALFSVAGFFYVQLREITATYVFHNISRRECYSFESISVTVSSFRFGIAWFSAIGLVAWATATYLALKWKSVRSVSRLP